MELARLFPGFYARRYRKLADLAVAQRLYQAATQTQFHPRKGDGRSGNAVMEHARGTVRNWGRYLEENADLAVGVLDDLTDRVVGAGIQVEPLPRLVDGSPATAFAETVRRLWADWGRAPDVSGVVPWGELQRQIFRTWMRDGEVLARHVINVPGYRYPGLIPYVIEAMEPDYLPFDLTQDVPFVTHGIERDEFGRITAYHLYERHPGEFMLGISRATILEDTVRVPAEMVLHLRISRRIGQVRGITIFHPCVHRLQDLQDYEESERLAAKIAASFSAVITKSPDTPGTLDRTYTTDKDRSFEMQSAMIFDSLMPGEKVETIESNRPSNALPDYRSAMLRAVSAGTGARYSTIARTWDSSYTAMRQETVSMMPGTEKMRDYFVARGIRPVYETFLRTAILSGAVDPVGVDPLTLFDAAYRGPAIPWIDVLNEAKADVLSINEGLKSRQQVIRERGGDPETVDSEREMDDFERVTDEGLETEPAT